MISIKGWRLLTAANPAVAIEQLARRVDLARSPITLQAYLDVIEDLRIERMLVAVSGTSSTARRLGVDSALADRLCRANPEVISETRLILRGDLDLRGLSEVTIPWVQQLEGCLFADRTRGLSLPSLESVGSLFAVGSKELSLPNLRKVRWASVIVF